MLNCPSVIIGRTGAGLPAVIIEWAEGGRRLARRLLDKGHRAIAIIGAAPAQVPVTAGFLEACAQAGAAVRSFISVETFMAEPVTATAVCCVTSAVLLEFHCRTLAAGFHPGTVLAVVGVDDLAIAGSLVPKPTVLLPDDNSLGEAAARLLVQVMQGTATGTVRLEPSIADGSLPVAVPVTRPVPVPAPVQPTTPATPVPVPVTVQSQAAPPVPTPPPDEAIPLNNRATEQPGNPPSQPSETFQIDETASIEEVLPVAQVPLLVIQPVVETRAEEPTGPVAPEDLPASPDPDNQTPVIPDNLPPPVIVESPETESEPPPPPTPVLPPEPDPTPARPEPLTEVAPTPAPEPSPEPPPPAPEPTPTPAPVVTPTPDASPASNNEEPTTLPADTPVAEVASTPAPETVPAGEVTP